MGNSSNSEARWEALSDQYRRILERGSDTRHLQQTLAMKLHAAIVAYFGCPEEYVSYYKCDTSYASDVSYTPVAGPYLAIESTDDGWTIGYGIKVEVNPNTFPKSNFTFPVMFSIDGDAIDVRSPMMMAPDSVRLMRTEPATHALKMEEVAESIHTSFSDAFEVWIRGGAKPQRIGFRFEDKRQGEAR